MSENIFKNLEPKNLWRHFAAFTKIARPSGREQEVISYIQTWSKQQGFVSQVDAVGNAVVTVPATPGLESKSVIVLQGHLDMVCERNTNSAHNAEVGDIAVVQDGDWIKAEDTTLGADNGIGVASLLALAEDRSIQHGPLELLFTIDEETGMTGAKGLDVSLVSGRTLINVDSEEDRLLFIGCAGGQDLKITFSGQQIILPADYAGLEITVGGLLGGHSGVDINHGRVNAVQVLAQAIQRTGQDYLLAEINGGSKRNAIPREARAVAVVPKASQAEFEKKLQQFGEQLNLANRGADASLVITVQPASVEKVFTSEESKRLINLLLAIPSGVLKMSQQISGLVEASTNLGVITTQNNQIEVFCLIRSSAAQSLVEVVDRHQAIAQLAGATLERLGEYPGWRPNMNSTVLSITKAAYEKLFGQLPEVTAIHAGLECGLIGERIPDMDMISLGPLILGAHAPGERVSLKSVQKFWQLLIEVLKDAS